MQTAKYLCTGSLISLSLSLSHAGADGSMNQADYSHYALHFACYTHFTSPIRYSPSLFSLEIHTSSGDTRTWWCTGCCRLRSSTNPIPSPPLSSLVPIHLSYSSQLSSRPPLFSLCISGIAKNCNRKKMNADKASEDCDYLFFCRCAFAAERKRTCIDASNMFLMRSRYIQRQMTPPVEDAIVIDLNRSKNWL